MISQTELAMMANEMVTQIRDMEYEVTNSRGVLMPRITNFSMLHDYIDANVGWSEEIDALPHDDWVTLSHAVDQILRRDWFVIEDIQMVSSLGDRSVMVHNRDGKWKWELYDVDINDSDKCTGAENPIEFGESPNINVAMRDAQRALESK